MRTKLFSVSQLPSSNFRFRISKQIAVILFFLLSTTFSLSAQEIVHIWPGKVPGETKEKAEAVATKNEEGVLNRVSEVTNPLFTVHRPSPSIDKKAGVVICPGGGYHILAINKEGYEVADWLNSLGYTAFVLQYRVPQKRKGALMDIQRTIRMVRSNAENYGIEPDRLGVLGFSAGGSLAARASTLCDKQIYDSVDSKDNESARPDFAVLIYAAYLDEGENQSLTPEIEVDENTPPMFLFATADDKHTSSSLAISRALRDAGVPVELHILPFGKHGYGLRSGNIAATTWPLLAEIWLGRFVGYKQVTD